MGAASPGQSPVISTVATHSDTRSQRWGCVSEKVRPGHQQPRVSPMRAWRERTETPRRVTSSVSLSALAAINS